MKYRPDIIWFPLRQDGREFCHQFVPWYDGETLHPGFTLLIPKIVQHGRAAAAIESHLTLRNAAYAISPGAFCPPTASRVAVTGSRAVWIN